MTETQAQASQVTLAVKVSPANAGDIRDKGSIPGSESSYGGGHGNPPQYLAWRIPWTEERSLADYSPQGHKESDTT